MLSCDLGLFGFVSAGETDVGLHGLPEVSFQDIESGEVGYGACGTETLYTEIVGDLSRRRCGRDLFEDGNGVRGFDVTDRYREVVSLQVPERDLGVCVAGDSQRDIFDPYGFDILFAHTVDGYELPRHRPLVLGPAPPDPALAYPEHLRDLLYRFLEIPVGLFELADEIRPAGHLDIAVDLAHHEVRRSLFQNSACSGGLRYVIVHPEKGLDRVLALHHRSWRSPVILSRSSDFAGPRPSAVTVPGGISVIPASAIIAAGIPASSARVLIT